MPHYYFHIRGGAQSADDDEGIPLADDEAAGREALRGARSILASEVIEGWLPLDERIEVEDGEGRSVLILSFAAAVGQAD